MLINSDRDLQRHSHNGMSLDTSVNRKFGIERTCTYPDAGAAAAVAFWVEVVETDVTDHHERQVLEEETREL